MNEPSKRVSWGRAVLLGLAAVAVVIVAGVIVVAAGAVKEAERFGRGLGRFSVVVFLVAMAVSYFSQTGRRKAARVLALGGIGLFAALIAVVLAVSPSHGPRQLSDAERLPLVEVSEAGHRLLSQPSLGFRLKSPGDRFQPWPERDIASMLASLGDTDLLHTWAWIDPSTGEFLVLTLGWGVDDRHHLEGVANGFVSQMAEQTGGEVLRNDLVWTDDRKQAWLEFELPGELYVSVRIDLEQLGPDRELFTVLFMAMTAEPGSLDAILDSFEAS